uniref:Photosystem I reaction center subunit VI n=1 Tax=Salix viminalis TaxID=40686 RepID=A0A6N2N8E2_SALVM
MASLATFAAVQPATIKGLSGSSLGGTKLHVKPSRQGLKPRSLSMVTRVSTLIWRIWATLLGNGTLYGSDAPSPYNSLQQIL